MVALQSVLSLWKCPFAKHNRWWDKKLALSGLCWNKSSFQGNRLGWWWWEGANSPFSLTIWIVCISHQSEAEQLQHTEFPRGWQSRAAASSCMIWQVFWELNSTIHGQHLAEGLGHVSNRNFLWLLLGPYACWYERTLHFIDLEGVRTPDGFAIMHVQL